MPREGQQISNPRTGQRMTFVELRDEQLRIDSVNPPTGEREPVHVHPKQESGAEVLSGALVFEVAGEQRRLGAGETISVPANTPHRFWNDGNTLTGSFSCGPSTTSATRRVSRFSVSVERFPCSVGGRMRSEVSGARPGTAQEADHLEKADGGDGRDCGQVMQNVQRET